MTLLPAMAALALGAIGGAAQDPQGVTVARTGAEAPTVGSSEFFTGAVRVEDRFQREAPARIGGATVTFEPGARTAWHTHPLGQTLIVTDGQGRVQHWGGEVQDIRPGDVVWVPPGVRHWHGAAPDAAMTHIAVAEALDGKSVDWLEQVSDAQYAP